MGLFGWGKKDEEWMQTTRRTPAWVGLANIQEGDPRWIVTQVFANPKKKNERVYFAAIKEGHPLAGSGWVISKFKENLKERDDGDVRPVSWIDNASTPTEVIFKLRRLERKCLDEGMIPVPVATATYIKFANASGLHVNDDGEIIVVAHDRPVLQNTLVTTEGLRKLFREVSKQKIRTWQDFYDHVINKPSAAGVTVADLAADPMGWPDLVIAMKAKFPTYGGGWDPLPYFGTEEKRAYADYLMVSKRLLSTLLDGAEEYDKILSAIEAGANIKDRLATMDYWVRKVTKISVKDLGLSKETAEDIVNIMTSGRPAELPPLPHERVLKDSPPTPRKEPRRS